MTNPITLSEIKNKNIGLSDFIYYSKYARYNENLKRRETWEETVNRVCTMHINKYSFLSDEDKNEILWAFNKVYNKEVMPSMRSLQFGGLAIEVKNSRQYNCCVRHVDSLRSFAEIHWLLLCGTGVGIGLSKYFLNRLPDLVSDSDRTGTVITYVIEDTIEGWANALEALLMCYFKNTAYTGKKIIFDYSKIRRKGTRLKVGGGKAPGHTGLKLALTRIKALLDDIIEHQKVKRIRPIHCYDILMHAADSVLSGGVRRSACSIIFDKDDDEMIKAKTNFLVEKYKHFVFDKETQEWHGKVKIHHKWYNITFDCKNINSPEDQWDYVQLTKNNLINWFYIEPQRARSNNSVLLLRDKITFEEFLYITKFTKEYGEPGFVFADHPWTLFNPCQPKWAPVLTENGIKPLSEIRIGDKIWSEEGFTTVINKWSTGVKKVLEYRTTAGIFYGTENHKIVSNNTKIEVKDAESIDCLRGTFHLKSISHNPQAILDGLLIGDGTVHKASNNLILLCIGENDQDYFSSEISQLLGEYRPGIDNTTYKIQSTKLTTENLVSTYNRTVPDEYFYANPEIVASFLRGLYSANGSVISSRITLKTSSANLRDRVQIMLNSLGIKSYFTTNKPKKVLFENGEYICKESYDINITTDRNKFATLIGFIQNYKNIKLANILNSSDNIGKTTFDIISIKEISEEEVFDITVDNQSHTYWTGGVNVSNCFEIGFIPVTDDGVCGVQFCNLSTQNGGKIKSKKDFAESVKAATIIGTLQAGWTNFDFLGPASKFLTEQEALLGVSITGMMANPDIILDPKIQKEMAEIAKSVNKSWASKIKINQAARITCIKPEGTSSLFLETSSGIHPYYDDKYFRRVQCNKIESPYIKFKSVNPHACEKSVWSASDTDDVATFPIEAPPTAILRKNLGALEHLEIIKNTQMNWVLNGTTEANNKPLTHNVSCTVYVKNHEWNDVYKYIFENKQYFGAVSLLPDYGDQVYQQAPYQSIRTDNDIKLWNNLVDNWSEVNFLDMNEDDDHTHLQQEMACAGGKCEL